MFIYLLVNLMILSKDETSQVFMTDVLPNYY